MRGRQKNNEMRLLGKKAERALEAKVARVRESQDNRKGAVTFLKSRGSSGEERDGTASHSGQSDRSKCQCRGSGISEEK